MQTVIVAGGAGFIGTHLCKSLLGGGYKVVCVDNFLTSDKGNISNLLENANFSLVEKDIINISSGDLPSSDFIFHLASPASPNHHSKISYHALPEQTMLANTTGTFNLLNLAKEHNARFLFASSSEVYGEPLEHPQNEEYRGNVSSTGPRSVYDESKRFGETITAYYGRDKELDIRIARIFNTYGPGMMKEDMRMIIVFITQAIEGKPITIFGDGNQTRSFCYITDTVDGLIKFMFKHDAKGQVINIGSSVEHTVLDYANFVKKLIGSNSEIVMNEPLPQDDPKERRPDIAKAKKLLDWAPKVLLEEGLTKTIQYFKNG